MSMSEHVRTLSTSDRGSAKKVLFELQVEQHHHDELYHREIARLSLHQRLNHMALHFAKYAGKIAAATDTTTIAAIFTDMFIIALSSANILNIELWEHLPETGDREHANLLTFGRALAVHDEDFLDSVDALLREVVVASGRIAAACEKIDHLELVAFRTEIAAGLSRLAEISLALLARQGIDPAGGVRKRLSDVKSKSTLHGWI